MNLLTTLAFMVIGLLIVVEPFVRHRGNAVQMLQRRMAGSSIIMVLGNIIAFTNHGVLLYVGIAFALGGALVLYLDSKSLKVDAVYRSNQRNRPTGALERPEDYWRNHGH